MLLAIDVGNTNTVLGAFEGESLRQQWRVETSQSRTYDEWGILVRQLYASVGLDPARVRAIAISSVVPPLAFALEQMSQRYFGVKPLFVGPGVKTGLPILYDNPREVGADRVVNALAAFQRFGGPAVVVDFGTSTNFDVVSDKGEFLGGVIAPGLQISAAALVGRTARLTRVDLQPPRSPIGKSTVEAIQSGLLYGTAGEVDAIVDRIRAELDAPDAPVVATGGLAPVVIPHCRTVGHHEPWLTLHGLRMVYDHTMGDADA